LDTEYASFEIEKKLDELKLRADSIDKEAEMIMDVRIKDV